MFYTNVSLYGNNILIHEMDEFGMPHFSKEQYKPSVFLPGNGIYKDFYTGKPLQEKKFNSIYEMKKYINDNRDVMNWLWGEQDPVSQFISEKYGYDMKYDFSKIRIAFIDIECSTGVVDANGKIINGSFPVAEEANYPINAITLYNKKNDTYYVFGLNIDWTKEKCMFPELKDKVKYYNNKTEAELLKRFLIIFKDLKLDILSGWNNIAFDIPYIVNRINKVLGEKYSKLLSPWGIVKDAKTKSKFGNTIKTYEFVGLSILDYMELYRKYGAVQESYTLDFVANAVVGEKKVEFEGTHFEFYVKDPVKFLDYNINDVSLLVKMEEKLALMNLVTWISYFGGVNYPATMGPIKIWETLIFKECYRKNIIIPMVLHKREREEYIGAWVFDVKEGFCQHVASFDFTSLYPSINRTWNIGAESIIPPNKREKILSDLQYILSSSTEEHASEFLSLLLTKEFFIEYYIKYNSIPECVKAYLRENNISMTPNWQFFDNTKESIFTTLQTKLFNGRKADKKQMQKAKQEAKDIKEELKKRGITVND